MRDKSGYHVVSVVRLSHNVVSRTLIHRERTARSVTAFVPFLTPLCSPRRHCQTRLPIHQSRPTTSGHRPLFASRSRENPRAATWCPPLFIPYFTPTTLRYVTGPLVVNIRLVRTPSLVPFTFLISANHSTSNLVLSRAASDLFDERHPRRFRNIRLRISGFSLGASR